VCFLTLLALAVIGSRVVAAEGDELFSGGVVPNLRIEIPADGMRVLRSYHQERGQPRPPRVDVQATVREGDKVYTNVAVHLKGSWSFEPVDRKPSLTLNFDKFAPGQRFRGLDKIHLNNSAQDFTCLHEALAREVFNEAGVPAPRAGHATASLNGKGRGLYVLVEGTNKRFVKRHFKSAAGNLYDGGSGGDISSPRLNVNLDEHQKDRSDLNALIAATKEPNPAKRFSMLDQVLDVDRFLTFAALEVLFVHWDGYCNGPNNYHIFHDAGRGKMVFMPHGMDQILAGHPFSTSLTPQWKGAVARALFTTGEGHRRYLERINQVFTNHFQADKLNAKVDQLAQRIRPAATSGMLDSLQFQIGTRNLKSRITQRVNQVSAQLARPEKPASFSTDGTLRPTAWRFRNGTQGNSSGRTTSENGREILDVRANGPGASGSWRQTVTLPPGRYELRGLGKVTGLPAGTPGTGVLLRISGERSVEGISTATSWSPVRYEFATEVAGSYELICEYRGAAGAGSFDLSSLKLERR
jgi:spore coat protein H